MIQHRLNTFLFVILFMSTLSCFSQSAFDLQGHRGTRGLMPENTIPAFIKAIDLGVTTLEMDVVITKNKTVLVSHEPYISADYCLNPSGQNIPDSLEKQLKIYEMDDNAIQQYDCGSKPYSKFPEQQKIKLSKPTLQQVFNAVENYVKENNLQPIHYNIEIKSDEKGDNIFHPSPSEFSELVFTEIDKTIGWSNVCIQSFDFRILQYFHAHYPEVKLALLISNKKGISDNIHTLGFTPQIYSCYYVLLSHKKVDQLHAMGMVVIPWTVNEEADMKRVIDWGVDGLITDYPNRYNQLK